MNKLLREVFLLSVVITVSQAYKYYDFAKSPVCLKPTDTISGIGNYGKTKLAQNGISRAWQVVKKYQDLGRSETKLKNYLVSIRIHPVWAEEASSNIKAWCYNFQKRCDLYASKKFRNFVHDSNIAGKGLETIYGIGPAHAKKLKEADIDNAKQLICKFYKAPISKNIAAFEAFLKGVGVTPMWADDIARTIATWCCNYSNKCGVGC